LIIVVFSAPKKWGFGRVGLTSNCDPTEISLQPPCRNFAAAGYAVKACILRVYAEIEKLPGAAIWIRRNHVQIKDKFLSIFTGFVPQDYTVGKYVHKTLALPENFDPLVS
jgi:hypothetical protein